MDRRKAEDVIQLVFDKLNDEGVTNNRITIAGSFRRGKKKDLHDVDFIIEHEYKNGKRERIEVLDEPVDLVYAQKECLGPALLYLTGSKWNNIRMRKKAQEKNWKLSQYGLFNQDGERIDENNEQSIYNLLEMEYLDPERR